MTNTYYVAGIPFNSHDSLTHHGIKGQKWGIRRYQNPDGTLTEEGKKRYGVGDEGLRNLYAEKKARIEKVKNVTKKAAKTAIALGVPIALGVLTHNYGAAINSARGILGRNFVDNYVYSPLGLESDFSKNMHAGLEVISSAAAGVFDVANAIATNRVDYDGLIKNLGPKK